MADPAPRIAALIAQVAALEAAVRTGGSGGAVPAGGYPFLAKLAGDDLITAQAIVQENAVLRKKAEELQEALEERDYRIDHLKRNLERLIP